MPGTDGERCPYLTHEPRTDAGWAAWDVLTRATGQLRIAPGGLVLGLDLGVALAIGTALGHAGAALAELLSAGEAGLVRALNERIAQDH